MAVKGIKIGDSVSDEENASGSITTIFTTITGVHAHKKPDNSGDYDCEIFVKYHRTEGAYDANKLAITNWAALPASYILEMTEAQLDASGTSTNDAFYNALETAMGANFSNLTPINKT